MTDTGRSRHGARETAFQVLYGLSYSGAPTERDLEKAFAKAPVAPKGKEVELVSDVPYPEQQTQGFAWELTHGVWDKRTELDEIINKFSQHWRVTRIAKIELTILRLAVYEMLYRDDVPTKVAINEAVELSKQYGDENSKGFVNGILDAAAKALEHGEIGVHQGR